MIKKEITYQDLDGKDVTKTYYFSIPPTELFSLDSEFGGLEGAVKKIINEKNTPEIVRILNGLVSKSVGVNKDGEFCRSEDITQNFMNSEAYSSLVIEFLTEPLKFAEFCRGILPAKLAEKLPVSSGELELSEKPAEKKLADYTRKELMEMPKEEFDRVTDRVAPHNMSPEVLTVAFMRRQAGK